jgi:hypothetical protein
MVSICKRIVGILVFPDPLSRIGILVFFEGG